MSEAQSENPNQAVQPGADETAQPSQPVDTSSAPSSGDTFPIRLIKQETGETHWNVAKGVWETITHGETGEPNAEYVLLATINGVDVPLQTYNAGGIETIVRSQQQSQAQQSSAA